MLHEATATRWKVMDHVRLPKGQAIVIDHVDIGELARRQDSAVVQPVDLCRRLRLLMHQDLDRDLWASTPVTRPVCEHVRGHRCVADESAVGAPVTQTEDRRGVLDHGADRLVILIDIAAERHEHHRRTAILEHPVVDDLLRRAALPFGNRRNRHRRFRLVIGRVAQRKHLMERRRHEMHEPVLARWLLGQKTSLELRVTQVRNDLGVRLVGDLPE